MPRLEPLAFILLYVIIALFQLAGSDTHGQSEQRATEVAVMPAEIEQLPDRCGLLKVPSQPAWMRVSFPYYDMPKRAESFVGA